MPRQRAVAAVHQPAQVGDQQLIGVGRTDADRLMVIQASAVAGAAQAEATYRLVHELPALALHAETHRLGFVSPAFRGAAIDGGHPLAEGEQGNVVAEASYSFL